MGAPGRAIAALEAARAADPGSRTVLQRLEPLYRDTRRPREQAEILELLIADASAEERFELRCTAADLYAGVLGRPERAAQQLWEALREAPSSGVDRIELLRRLSSAFLSLGRKDLWARTAEEELASLDPGAEVFSERRRELQLELGRVYDLSSVVPMPHSDAFANSWKAASRPNTPKIRVASRRPRKPCCACSAPGETTSSSSDG